jgi:hypothetical protein
MDDLNEENINLLKNGIKNMIQIIGESPEEKLDNGEENLFYIKEKEEFYNNQKLLTKCKANELVLELICSNNNDIVKEILELGIFYIK